MKGVIQFFQRRTFGWLSTLFDIAQSKTLEEDDMPKLPDEWLCNPNYEQLSKCWKSMETPAVRHLGLPQGSLLASLFKIYGCSFINAGYLLAASSILAFSGPLMLSLLISSAENNASSTTIAGLIALQIALRCARSFFVTDFYFQVVNIGVGLGAGIKGCLFAKSLQLSAKSSKKFTPGVISNLYTVDVDRIVRLTRDLHNLWVLPVQILLCMILLYREVSLAMFGGLTIIIILFVANNLIADKMKLESDAIMIHKDSRMKAVGEYLNSVLIVKVNAWEDHFEEKILQIRNEEMNHIRNLLIISAFLICLFWMAPSLIAVSTIYLYAVSLGRQITASRIFTALSLFRLLQGPLREFPMLVSQLYQAWTSIERLEEFYDCETVGSKYRASHGKNQKDHYSLRFNSSLMFCWDNTSEQTNAVAVDAVVSAEACKKLSFYQQIAVAFPDLLNRWNPWKSQFAKVNTDEEIDVELTTQAENMSATPTDGHQFEEEFRVKFDNDVSVLSGQLVVVEGSVGSGKSSLCAAILGEMYGVESNSSYEVNGTVAFASQQSWIQHMSLRDNILFCSEYKEDWYQQVVSACCLLADFDELPEGDFTEIGEKGLNLSGGQKARVALARAVYADTDIIILDDVLSALDSIVAKKVFEQCIVDLLSKKTRILMTHNLDVIHSNHVDINLSIKRGIVTCVPPEKLTNSSEGSSDQEEKQACDIESDRELTQPMIAPPSPTRRGAEVSEMRATGAIDKEVYARYFNALGGWKTFLFLCCVQIVWQYLYIRSDLFLAEWSKQSDIYQQDHLSSNLLKYACLAIGSGAIVLVRTMTVSLSSFVASKWLFENLIRSLLTAPMVWYDQNPSGRILNRISDDQASVDLKLGFAVGSIFAVGFALLGILITVLIVSRYLVFAVVPALIIYLQVLKKYLTASREIQRILRISQSPVLTFLSESVLGMTSIRAFGSEKMELFKKRNESLIDANSRMLYATNAATSWYILRIQLIGTAILLVLCILVLFGRHYLSAGLIGLSLSYGLDLCTGLENLVYHISDLENMMVCPERLLQYIGIPPEGTSAQKELYKDRTLTTTVSPLPISDIDDSLFINFPVHGQVKFEHVWFKYQVDGDYVLKDVSFNIKGGSKVGIVGRTGSGKSSLSMCLFRIAELSSGRVTIDGIDVGDLPLKTLRSSIEIIPQMPVLFKGTLRAYLDPFNEYSNDSIWQALKKAQLVKVVISLNNRKSDENKPKSTSRDKSTTNPIGDNSHNDSNNLPDDALESMLDENGSNLSVGERQLLVLSRALLRKAKIVVMDEATASVDSITDSCIQEVLKEELKESTVITIAHRIETIMHSDLILVMDAGQLVEFGSPSELLQSSNSIYSNLAISHGLNR